MRNKFLIISLAMSGFVAGQHEIKCDHECRASNNIHPVSKATIHGVDCNVSKTYFNIGYHHCIMDSCRYRIHECKIIPFCEKHRKDLINNDIKEKDIDVRTWLHYTGYCEYILEDMYKIHLVE